MTDPNTLNDDVPAGEVPTESASFFGDPDAFKQQMEERAKNMNPERVDQLLLELERSVQSADRHIELYTDPGLSTFCCAEVPAKRVTKDGTIVEDPGKKTFLIGIPHVYAAGEAPLDFMRGEIAHERGHAEWTDFGVLKRLKSLATSEGRDPAQLLKLNNIVEDPRMERLVGGPLREPQRMQLFAKNRTLIIPSIAQSFSSGKMSPADQFAFMIKLERLWALHAKELQGVEKPWNPDDMDPLARDEYLKLEPVIARITGDASLPSMKDTRAVEQLIVQEIWPAMKRLLDAAQQKKEQEARDDKDGNPQNSGGDQETGNDQPPGEGRQSGKSDAGRSPKQDTPDEGEGSPVDDPENGQHLDPKDPESWPPHMRRMYQKMKERHEQRLEKEAEEKKLQAERDAEAKARLEAAEHELKKTRDGFEDPVLRKQYEAYKGSIVPITNQMSRVFQRFLPKIVEPQFEYGRRGIKFSVQNLVRRYRTGQEKPLGKRINPEKSALVLQILIDVSGSMYADPKRIENAVKACIATCEGSEGHNVTIEILASDDKNIGDDDKYLIKAFDEPYNGRVKSRLMTMLKSFGGDNKDAAAIDIALPRIHMKKQQMRVEADRVGSLMVFITDSTTKSADTKAAADRARLTTPLEGTVITPEQEISDKVKYHFGKESIIPPSVSEFPSGFQQILQRHIAHLRTNT